MMMFGVQILLEMSLLYLKIMVHLAKKALTVSKTNMNEEKYLSHRKIGILTKT